MLTREVRIRRVSVFEASSHDDPSRPITSNAATPGGDIRRKFVHQHKVCRKFTLRAAKTLISIRHMALAKPNVFRVARGRRAGRAQVLQELEEKPTYR